MDLYLPYANTNLPWPVLVLLGLAIGTLQGFFGVGGGWLTTPSLNILGFPMVFAIGTDLAFTAASALVGSTRHYRLGNLEVRLAAVLGLSGMAGVEVARRGVLALESSGAADTYIRLVYIALLWGVGGSILLEHWRGRARHGVARASAQAEVEPKTRLAERVQAIRLPPSVRLAHVPTPISLWVLAWIGICVGLVSGTLGVGGGFIMVPVLVYVLGLPTRVAVASSLFSIVISAAYGAVSYGMVGRVEPAAAGLLFAGAVVGVQFGALATVHAPGKAMRVLLGATLALAGVAVFLQQVGVGLGSMAVMFTTGLGMTAAILGLLVRSRLQGSTPVKGG